MASTVAATSTNTTATLPTANTTSTGKSGCHHTQTALAQNVEGYLRSYEMAVRISLQKSLLASTAKATTHKGTNKQQNGSARRATISGKTLPGGRKQSPRLNESKRHKPPRFMSVCETCQSPESTSIVCLECPYVGCISHFTQVHTASTRHSLGTDLAIGCEGLLYCGSCKNYVYNDQFEEVRLRKIQQFLALGVIEDIPSGALSRSHDSNSVASQIVENKAALPPYQATSALRGFYNMGATCFMSVIFQSLIHNPLVRNFYLAGGHEKGLRCGNAVPNNSNSLGIRRDGESERGTADGTPEVQNPSSSCLACALDDVFAEFYSSSSVAGFGPTNLLTASWRVKKSLAGYSEQDAHEFLQMVLNELHATHYDSQVLADGTARHLSRVGMPEGCLPSARREREDVNIQSCGCISHRTFCGELESKITCQTCGTVSSTVCDPMMDLSLEIGNLTDHGIPRQPVAGKTVPKAMPPKSVTLEQCLDRFTAGETLEATFKCNVCNAKRPIQKRLSIRRLPSVLSIQLKVSLF